MPANSVQSRPSEFSRPLRLHENADSLRPFRGRPPICSCLYLLLHCSHLISFQINPNDFLCLRKNKMKSRTRVQVRPRSSKLGRKPPLNNRNGRYPPVEVENIIMKDWSLRTSTIIITIIAMQRCALCHTARTRRKPGKIVWSPLPPSTHAILLSPNHV